MKRKHGRGTMSMSETNGARRQFLDYLVFFASFIFPHGVASGFPQEKERININEASLAELARLPGIGAAIAARIVEHRRKHGLFKRPQDIIIVRGMSAKRYRRIEHLIRI
jgi:competence ComEA-like helix-hairpin-helix protein